MHSLAASVMQTFFPLLGLLGSATVSTLPSRIKASWHSCNVYHIRQENVLFNLN